MEYKNTLNLPQTDFPMRAGLVQREPERLAKWYADSLYEQIQKRREGAERFLLHDGPPFANGDVHIGTALNKILKDFILKYQTMRGKHVPYVPGWDCHGLPIEFKVTQQMRKDGNTDATPAAIRKACEEYALGFIDTQREQFKRLGVLGEWDNPYLTLNPAYEAEELRLFADLVEKGFVYRGKKPVYWSIPCRTALAEAEVEYQDHVSQSVYVKFPIVGETNMHLLIWTTTPWTLPANLAVAYNSQFDYQLIRVGEEALLVSVPLLDTVVEKCGWAGDFEILRTVQGDQLEEFEYHHPFCNRTGKLFAGDMFVDDSAGTGLVHIAPGHGQDDYNLGRNNGLPIYSPVDDSGRLARTADLPEEQQISDELVGKQILPKNGRSEANEAVIEVLKAGDKLAFEERYEHSYPHCWRSKSPVIFRAMDQWFVNIDHDGFRDKALAAIDSVNNALILKPSYADALAHRAELFLEVGDLDKAISDYETAIQSTSYRQDRFYFKIGKIQASKKNFIKAVQNFQKARKINKANGAAWKAETKAYIALGNKIDAAKALKKYILLNPEDEDIKTLKTQID